jgi:hypothetical protein
MFFILQEICQISLDHTVTVRFMIQIEQKAHKSKVYKNCIRKGGFV